MHYLIYKITNTLNGKTYIGKHQTKDINDGYFGSGKILKKAIKKYGIEVFVKEILFDFDNEWEMNAKEKELVTIEVCMQESTYNLCPGGNGGFGYINHNTELRLQKNRIARERANANGAQEKAQAALAILRKNPAWDSKRQEKRKTTLINKYGKEGVSSFLGRSHTQTAKDKISANLKGKGAGENNSQFGTCWISHSDHKTRKIEKHELVSYLNQGWVRGRK